MTVRAIIFCKIEHKAMSKVVDAFKRVHEITKVFSLTGEYDILAEIEVETTDQLYEVFEHQIDLIDGVINTNTHVVMASFEK